MDEFNKEANDAIHGQIFAALGRIEAQTTATNGRVRLLEKMVWLACGGLSVLSFFFAQDKLILANEQEEPVTAEQIADRVIELQAEALKLQIDAEQVIQ